MQTLTAKVTPRLLNELDHLIEDVWYTSRSEAIRDAIRKLIENKTHSKMMRAVEEDINWGLHGK